MVQYIIFPTTITLLLLASTSLTNVNAFEVTPGGGKVRRPITTTRPNQNPTIGSSNPSSLPNNQKHNQPFFGSIGANPKPLRAVAIKPLAREGSWNAYLDEEETGLIYYFNTITGERTWKPPSPTFPDIPVDKWVTQNVKTLRESYLKEYKSKRNFFMSPVQNAFGRKKFNHFFMNESKQSSTTDVGTATTTTTTAAAATTTAHDELQPVSSSSFGQFHTIGGVRTFNNIFGKPNDSLSHHHLQEHTTKPTSTTSFAHASAARIGNFIDVQAEPTLRFIGRGQQQQQQQQQQHKLEQQEHLDIITQTPIDKLVQNDIIVEKDENFVVAKEVFETFNEQPSKAINNSLNEIRERVENTKTFLTGMVSGGVAVAPVVALQDIVMKFSLSADAMNEFYLDTAFCSFQAALFAIMLRFCLQDDQKDNDFLKNGIVASSAFLRTMIMTSNDQFGWQMIQHLTFGGMESFAMFTAVAAVFDFGCKHGILSQLNMKKL